MLRLFFVAVATVFFAINGWAASFDTSKPYVCEDKRFVFPADQLDRLANAWGRALHSHQVKLNKIFLESKPANYRQFAERKVGSWQPPFDFNRSKMSCSLKQFGRPVDTAHAEIYKIYLAMVDLNTVSINMQSYLRSGNKKELNFIQGKLSEISEVSNKYPLKG